ncbi:MAG: F0F1 ATP synthase subunit delta [Sedimenticolaceae bacterium]
MELNWSTFLLEIINFLVLVWILKRFLYQPVLDVIARRRNAIEGQLAEAHRLQDEADSLKAQYEDRLADWERERHQAKETLARQLDEESTRQLSALQGTLDQEREKSRVAEERQHTEQQRAIEHQALQLGAVFSSRLLGQTCGPELEARLLNLLLEELHGLSEQQTTGLRQQWGEPPQTIEVSSAFELAAEQRQQLEAALHQASGLSVPVRFIQDETLLAGLHIVIGAWVLAANVRDELKGFAEFARAPR